MYERFAMKGFSQGAALPGLVFDTNTVMKDLLALYSDPSVDVGFVDPNPPADGDGKGLLHYQGSLETDVAETEFLKYWHKLKLPAETMQNYKRNGPEDATHGKEANKVDMESRTTIRNVVSRSHST